MREVWTVKCEVWIVTYELWSLNFEVFRISFYAGQAFAKSLIAFTELFMK